MKCVKKVKIVLAAVFCALAFSGCYTKLAYYQDETAPYAERCDECIEERPVPRSTREVCVWERDMFGFAQLRCYNSNYSSSWMYFHNTPWWYRNQYRWYETRGCPPYYYYDRVSGTCRYYGKRPPGRPGHPPGGGSSTGGSASSGSGVRAPRREAGSQPAQQSHEGSVPMFPASSTKQLSPVGAPNNTSSSSSNDALSKGGQNETPPQVTPPPPEQKPQSQEENHSPPSRRPSRGAGVR
jgi:hypothetical protein